VLKSNS